MTRKGSATIRIAVMSLAGLLLASGGARAQAEADDTSGEVVAGPQGRVESDNHDSAKFEEFRDVPNGFVAEKLLFSWEPKNRYYLDFDGRDISQRDQRLGLVFGRQDRWRASFSWLENPRHWTDQARTLFAERSGGVFTLNDSFQAAVQAAAANADTTPADGMWDAGTKGAVVKSAIEQNAFDVDVLFQRRTGGARFEYTPTRSWTFGVAADRERRSGSTPQPLGMYFSLSPAEVAAPVDFRTDNLTLSAELTRPRWNLGAQLAASEFATGYDAITWDDQLFLTDTALTASLSSNPARGRMNPWQDNDQKRALVYAGFNLPGHTRIDATVSRSETTQDDPFLAKTINSVLLPVAAPLPASSLDGKYRDTVAQLRVSSRPSNAWRWNTWFRQYDHANETPSLVFTDYVITDYQIPQCGNVNVCDGNMDTILNDRIQRRNLPYAWERTNFGASGGWTPVKWLDATLSLERESMKREFSAVEDSDEDIAKLALDFDVAEWLTLRATARRQERRADTYEAHYSLASFPIGESIEAAFNEGMRRFIWTDRDRDAYSLLAEVTPGETFSIYAEATLADDTYLDPNTGRKIGDSFTIMEDRNFDTVLETYDILLAGRTDDRNRTWTLGFTWVPVERFNLFADYTWEDTRYGLETRYRCPGPTSAGCPGALFPGVGSDSPLDNWGSDADDKYKTANLGFGLALAKNRRWTLTGDVSRSTGTGDIETHFVPGGAASGDTTLTEFPRLKTTLSIGRLAVFHALRPNLDYGIRYWYESWEEDNWASDQMQPYMGDPGNDPGSATAIYLGMDYKDYHNHILSALLRYTF